MNTSSGRTLVRLIYALSPLLLLIPFLSVAAQTIDDNEVGALDWSPDGSKIAIGGGPTGCGPGQSQFSIQILDSMTGHVLQRLSGAPCRITSVAWSPDGTKLASTDDSGALIWDVVTGRVINEVKDAPIRSSASWNPNGASLATIFGMGSSIDVFDLTAKDFVRTFALRRSKSNMASIDWSPDGTKIVSSSANQVLIWDAHATETIVTQPLQSLQGHQDFVFVVRWSPDGLQIASGSSDNTIHVWDASNGKTLLVIETPVDSLDWHPSGNAIASGSEDDRTVSIWDSHTGALIDTIPSKVGKVLNVAWSPDGTRLAYVGSTAGPNGNYLDIVPAPGALAISATPMSP